MYRSENGMAANRSNPGGTHIPKNVKVKRFNGCWNGPAVVLPACGGHGGGWEYA